MRLTPSERDRLLLFTAAELARARLARGTRLNVPEATALVADTVVEAARDGARRAVAVEAGRSVLTEEQVLPGVVELVPEVWVEAGFDDGTRLVVVEDPFRAVHERGADAPGEIIAGTVTPAEPVWADVVEVEVENTAAVPVHVTSHMHFFEVNPALRFDRAAAYGRRLAIEAGTSMRFDGGAVHLVRLVPFGGDRILIGFAGLVDGPLDAPGAFEQALERARACGYLDSGGPEQTAAGEQGAP
jgi:urease subunit gamma/beta